MNPRTTLLLLLVALPSAGCVKQIAVGVAADALSSGSGTYASDADPELVREAIPFGLKTIEALIDAAPDDDRLLLAAASGFAQYAYGFLLQDADRLEPTDPARAAALVVRARRLLARAHAYGLRGLEARHEGFRAALARKPAVALAELEREDVPLLYWTAAALGAEISTAKDDMNLVGELPVVEDMMRRALELDEAWDAGSIHEFMVTLDGSRSEAMGGSVTRAKAHYDRALALSGGKKIGPLVTWAEVVAVANQDRATFDALLGRALAFDADSEPKYRLANLIAQDRARRLVARASDLFVEDR